MALAESDILCSSRKPPEPGIHCLFLSAVSLSRIPGEWLIRLYLQYSRAFLAIVPDSLTFFSQASYKGRSVLWSGLSEQGPIFWYKFSGFANLLIVVTKKIPDQSNLWKDFFNQTVLGETHAVGKVWWQKREASGHVALRSGRRAWRVLCSASLSFLSGPESQSMEWSHPQLRWVFLLQLSLTIMSPGGGCRWLPMSLISAL